MSEERFVIYNASAGSGKTFQIATRYLNQILQSTQPFVIHKLLGVTFTNKAAEEMKKRIVENLIQAVQGNLTDVMAVVKEDLRPVIMSQLNTTDEGLYEQELIKRSRKRLQEILHYYDEFQLTTIDKLMFKIIKTFARDMRLSVDVEVVLEYREVIKKLIDKLINQAQPGSVLSDFLINFSLQKIDNERFWDIKEDLVNINNIIFDDNYFQEIQSLTDKSLTDFVKLNHLLTQRIKEIEKQFVSFAQQLNEAFGIHKAHINKSVLTLSRKLALEFSKIEIVDKLRKTASDNNYAYYVKSHLKDLDAQTVSDLKGTINDALQQIMLEVIRFVDDNLEQYKFLLALRKEVNALSIENELQKEIVDYKLSHNSIFISDFNRLILEQILKDLETDTPYIYMRLGEKYAHYFVDEFQDTSVLQWQNMIPLIKEALSKEFADQKLGTAMLVGDAKQSIYRFRGGKPEQFIALSNPELHTGAGNPFAPLVRKRVAQLDYNWRSQPQIVDFNNRFFQTFTHLLPTPYKEVYEKVAQKVPKHKNMEAGYVQIRFLAKADKKKNQEKESFEQAVAEAILQAENKGYKKDEICILVNKHTDGVKISEHLIQQNIPVVSSETLLVDNALKVQFLLSWLRFLAYGATTDLYRILHFLIERDHLDKAQIYEDFFSVNYGFDVLEKFFKRLGYRLDFQHLLSVGVYDTLVYLTGIFQLGQNPEEQAYLQAFLEKAYRFDLQPEAHLFGFLQEWDQIADKFSIDTPDMTNAVRLMTVHKSKGLEFPVVIYYTAGEVLSSKDKENKVWVPLNPDEFKGFKKLPVSLKAIENSSNPEYKLLYEQFATEKSFDNLNRLYVALTRAVEQLYVILNSTSDKSKNTGHNDLFYNFLQSNGQDMQLLLHEFGTPKRFLEPETKSKSGLALPALFYHHWQDPEIQSGLKINTLSYERWAENKKQAIAYGMILHDILAEITTANEWKQNKTKYLAAIGETEKESIAKLIEKLLHHPDLKTYYTEAYQILNERSILIPDQQAHFIQKRPDRIVIKDNQAVVIDYKTGQPKPSHAKQLVAYAALLEEMGFVVKKKLIVYLHEEIQVENV